MNRWTFAINGPPPIEPGWYDVFVREVRRDANTIVTHLTIMEKPKKEEPKPNRELLEEIVERLRNTLTEFEEMLEDYD